jgi:aspartate-semialdehyde dehydrogenase
MGQSNSKRHSMAIVGAATLLGKELKTALEERNFPGLDIELFDEDSEAIGVLAEAAGEATFVRGLDEENFHGMRVVFVASSGTRAADSARAAAASGAAVIDLNPRAPLMADSVVRIPNIEKSFPEWAFTPRPDVASASRGAHPSSNLVRVPTAPVTIAVTLSAALTKFAPSRVAITFFPPVSERGQAGIDELETQTTRLLALQPTVQPVFGAQVAFNLISRYGAPSPHNLAETRDEAAREIADYIGGRTTVPAIQFIQAPVFYGYAFSAFADFGVAADSGAIAAALAEAGVKVDFTGKAAPDNISVADDAAIHMAAPAGDPNLPTALWLWGAADQFRLAAVNAVRAAEEFLAE